ncbi:MAG TPA: hydrogenase [Ruminococcaceae bacterium]|nr:hydrogenase [Oscillospiraceae bacterium]
MSNLSAEVSRQDFEKLANAIDLYKTREGGLIPVLHTAQGIFGYLPLEVQEFIARGMDIPLSEVSGVVSFYSYFSSVPKGKHTIRVCLGTACYVRGGKKIIEYLIDHLGVNAGETTDDGKFTLEVARCIGACGLAPAMMIDEKVYRQVNVNKLEQILGDY